MMENAALIKGKIIAIDYGTKRTGLAATDELQLIALPLETVNTSELLAYIQRYSLSNPIAAFVVGKPSTLTGEASIIAPHIRGFKRKLTLAFPQNPIFEVDERFTSSMAMQSMFQSGATKKQRADKSLVDKIAATLILQSFLEQRSHFRVIEEFKE
jgi:putative Holliday junction resolvase